MPNARPHPHARWTRGNHGVGHIDKHGDVVTVSTPQQVSFDQARAAAPVGAYAHFIVTPGGHVDARMTGPMGTTEFYRLLQQAHPEIAPKWTQADVPLWTEDGGQMSMLGGVTFDCEYAPPYAGQTHPPADATFAPQNDLQALYRAIGEAVEAGDIERAKALYQRLPANLRPRIGQKRHGGALDNGRETPLSFGYAEAYPQERSDRRTGPRHDSSLRGLRHADDAHDGQVRGMPVLLPRQRARLAAGKNNDPAAQFMAGLPHWQPNHTADHRRWTFAAPDGIVHNVGCGSSSHTDAKAQKVDYDRIRQRVRKCEANACICAQRQEPGQYAEQPQPQQPQQRPLVPGEQVMWQGQQWHLIEQDGEHAVLIGLNGQEDIAPMAELQRAAAIDPGIWMVDGPNWSDAPDMPVQTCPSCGWVGKPQLGVCPHCGHEYVPTHELRTAGWSPLWEDVHVSGEVIQGPWQEWRDWRNAPQRRNESMPCPRCGEPEWHWGEDEDRDGHLHTYYHCDACGMHRMTSARGVLPPIEADSPIAAQATDAALTDGGVTLSLDGQSPTSGYAFSPYPQAETVVPVSELSPADVEVFIHKNMALLKRPGHYLGLWQDGPNMYIDVTKVGPPTPDTVMEAARANQLALWDIDNNQEIRTGVERPAPTIARRSYAPAQRVDEDELPPHAQELLQWSKPRPQDAAPASPQWADDNPSTPDPLPGAYGLSASVVKPMTYPSRRGAQNASERWAVIVGDGNAQYDMGAPLCPGCGSNKLVHLTIPHDHFQCRACNRTLTLSQDDHLRVNPPESFMRKRMPVTDAFHGMTPRQGAR